MERISEIEVKIPTITNEGGKFRKIKRISLDKKSK